MKFSIITPSYNSESTIERAINSVLIQNNSIEHIIVDGGSTDGTVDILKNYPHLNWISEPDNGQVDAMRKGFAMSTGEIIGNLNADDYYLPGIFDEVKPYFLSGEIFVIGKVKVISEYNQTTWINDPEFTIDRILRHWEPNAFCVNPVGYFYKREVQESFPFNIANDDKHDLEFLSESAARFPIRKIDKVFGVFSHSMDAKTFQEQIRPSYWRNENFDFVNRLLVRMPADYQQNFSLDRERGYQLRRFWTIQDILKLDLAEKMCAEGEVFFFPEDGEDAYPSRCGFVDFNRPIAQKDWIIIVLTMGKVASKAVWAALKSLPIEMLPAQTYHTHQINPATISWNLPSQLPMQTQASVGLSLNKKFGDHEKMFKWKFIAGVRDPIACGLSGVFQLKKDTNDQLKLNVLKVVNYIEKHFDNEYKSALGIDVFKYKFDHQKGYTIIHQNNIEILIYRFENLPHIFPQAMKEFFGISDLQLPHVNLASKKDYAMAYNRAKEELRFDEETLDKIYSSRLVTHFYTEEEIYDFYQKWLNKKSLKKTKNVWNGLIYDIGMHEGQDTEFYLKKGFKVVAVDANPALVEKASRRFSEHILSGQLIILNKGIVEEPTNEKLSFYINKKNTEWSSFMKEIASRDNSPCEVLKVSCATLKDIIGEYGSPYYVKIDIEGHDYIALKSLLNTQPLPRYISVENGNKGMLTMLVEHGYSFFKYIQQNNVSELCLPAPCQEGLYVEHSFPFGASGPFGEETPGSWEDSDTIRKAIAKVWDPDGFSKKPDHDDILHGWFDLHAKLADSLWPNTKKNKN